MSDFKPMQGEMISVGSHNKTEREFVAMDGLIYICRGRDRDGYFPWVAARSLHTKPEPTPYTHETWPKQVVWMKATTENEVMAQVVAIDPQGVFSKNGFVSFSTAAVDYLISLDFCQIWQPCHYVPERE